MDHERWIVEKIKRAREVRGMSIAELARRSMIEYTQLGKVFRYERSLKPGECMRACFALDMAVNAELMPEEILAQLRELNMRDEGEPGKKK
ncbi:MAG: helix-turn-helix transcriptional regulator [Eggerthellaceae bacterium]|nr:helix-turn-helix transcriptional regulator [Eggerthellaceae bacterium]